MDREGEKRNKRRSRQNIEHKSLATLMEEWEGRIRKKEEKKENETKTKEELRKKKKEEMRTKN